MSVRVDGDIAWLEGACGVADAEPLFAALKAGRVRAADLSACRELHGAVTQALLTFHVVVQGEPADRFLRDFVVPALLRRRAQALSMQQGAAARHVA